MLEHLLATVGFSEMQGITQARVCAYWDVICVVYVCVVSS